jgi:uncharacterized membrane protein
MAHKKRVTKAEAKASIKRLHQAARRKERPKFEAPKPVVVRELPPQPKPEPPKLEAVSQEEPGKAVENEGTEEPEKVEAPEEDEGVAEVEKPQRKRRGIVIGDAVEFGWKAVKSHLLFFTGIFLLFGIVFFMIAGASAIATRVVLGLFLAGMSLGYFKLALDIVGGESPEFKELFSGFSLLVKYLVASIIYVVVVSVGLVLLVVPGVIWAVQFGFFPYVILEERSGPLKALRRSSELTSGVKARLITFALVFLGINLLGILALGIGMIISIPVSFIACAHVFRQLGKAHS